MNFNPELLSTEPTHRWHGVLVKVFSPRIMHARSDIRVAEYMEGENKGKWTTVEIGSNLVPLKEVQNETNT